MHPVRLKLLPITLSLKYRFEYTWERIVDQRAKNHHFIMWCILVFLVFCWEHVCRQQYPKRLRPSVIFNAFTGVLKEITATLGYHVALSGQCFLRLMPLLETLQILCKSLWAIFASPGYSFLRAFRDQYATLNATGRLFVILTSAFLLSFFFTLGHCFWYPIFWPHFFIMWLLWYIGCLIVIFACIVFCVVYEPVVYFDTKPGPGSKSFIITITELNSGERQTIKMSF